MGGWVRFRLPGQAASVLKVRECRTDLDCKSVRRKVLDLLRELL